MWSSKLARAHHTYWDVEGINGAINYGILNSNQLFLSSFPSFVPSPCPVPPCELQPAVFMVCCEPPHAPLLLPLGLAGAAARVSVIAISSPWGFTRVPIDVLTHVQ